MLAGQLHVSSHRFSSLFGTSTTHIPPEIKNPINLARAILEASSRPLTLRRVPPNLLVSQGATDFAWEQGIPVFPHEALVSTHARERYLRWQEDLKRAESNRSTNSSFASEEGNSEYEARVQAKQRRDHTNAILNSTWNEGQPDSPSPQTSPHETCPPNRSPSPSFFPFGSRVRGHSPSGGAAAKRARYTNPSEDRRTHSLLGPNSGGNEAPKTSPEVAMTRSDLMSESLRVEQSRAGSSDGHTSPTVETESYSSPMEIHVPSAFSQEGTAESPSKPYISQDDDMITDTVGAIAIDMYGNIAAGASSGGIGMKHRGRVGPAALVGVGAAVIPADPRDIENVSVAAVTSGTGEHMATTVASQKCCDRLYHCTRRAVGGCDVAATDEEAVESFVQADFMNHPGVRGSNSAGAIGVMAVKKTSYGYFLHFAHNTDSFALASLSSNEREPKCVMSRLGTQGNIVRGGRKISAS